MRRLPRDERGYPIPVIVMRTDSGKPIFAANDEGERQRCFTTDSCHICGRQLGRGRWFVGGHLSACAEHGWFMDGGMHDECAHYALKVCPYLAAPIYGKLVGQTMLARSDRKNVMMLPDETSGNPRPDYFVAVMAVGQEMELAPMIVGIRQFDYVRLVRPKPGTVRVVQFWQHGVEIDGLRETTAADVAAIDDTVRPDVARLWSLS